MGLFVLRLLNARTSPLVFLHATRAGAHLLGAVDPDGPLGAANVERVEVGIRVYDAYVWVGSNKLGPLGVERAWERIREQPGLTTLPDAPWSVEPVLREEAPS